MADGVKISQLPGASTPSDSDVVAGVQSGTTKKFSFANIYAWLMSRLVPEDIRAVPDTRTVNGKALDSDIALTASDVGARPDNWFPTAAQVGARPDTWTPSAQDVGAVPVASVGVAGGVPNLDEIGRVPQNQLPPYPTVPAASTSNPQDLGTASPGISDDYARSDHVHDMPSASDVGALAADGTAVAAMRLNWSHKSSEAQGWHRILTIPFSGTGLRRKFVILVEASGSGMVGILRCNWLRASASSFTSAASWIAVGSAGWADAATNVDGSNISLYINKTATTGQLVITILSSTNQNGNDINLQQYFADTTSAADYVNALPAGAVIASGPVAELDGAGNNIADGKLWYSSVPVSSGANQVVATISDSRITADCVLARIEFADPSLIMAGYSWATGAGNFTLTGAVFAATTANVLLIRKGN